MPLSSYAKSIASASAMPPSCQRSPASGRFSPAAAAAASASSSSCHELYTFWPDSTSTRSKMRSSLRGPECPREMRTRPSTKGVSKEPAASIPSGPCRSKELSAGSRSSSGLLPRPTVLLAAAAACCARHSFRSTGFIISYHTSLSPSAPSSLPPVSERRTSSSRSSTTEPAAALRILPLLPPSPSTLNLWSSSSVTVELWS
mmetsp:Transcript_10635/g.24670  ORF Transcript_10635/g.24670 Transcript_10635/m.24670 type:complete len:202 (-) Transcript_10635:455-1060(-)